MKPISAASTVTETLSTVTCPAVSVARYSKRSGVGLATAGAMNDGVVDVGLVSVTVGPWVCTQAELTAPLSVTLAVSVTTRPALVVPDEPTEMMLGKGSELDAALSQPASTAPPNTATEAAMAPERSAARRE
ncbi:hypothetical protein [Sphingomonas sp.]